MNWTRWYSIVLDSLNNWVSGLPIGLANTITMLLFGILLVILWSFPFSTITRDAPDKRRWRDYRIWATLLVFIQLGIYAIFR